MAAQMIEPIRVTQTLKPRSVTEPKPGVFIFDLGQNMVGWCRLKVSGPRGTTVTLRHAEVLKPDGTLYLDNIRSAKVTDTYKLQGRGLETLRTAIHVSWVPLCRSNRLSRPAETRRLGRLRRE